MIVFDNIKFAFASIWANRIRSALTMLGVIIGVFAIIILTSIGEGVRTEFSDQVEGIGSNLVIVLSGQLDFEDEEGINPAQAIGVSTLTESDVEAINDQVEEVEKTAPMTIISGLVTQGEQKDPNTMILSTTPEFSEIIEYTEVEQGRFFNQEDYDQEAKVVVVGALSKDRLFPDQEEVVGQKVSFIDQEFEVVGTLKMSENPLEIGGTSFDRVVILPMSTGKAISERVNIIRIMNKVKNAELVEQAVESIESVMLEQHNGTEDFSVLTMEDVLDLFNSMFSILTKAITGIAAISLIVGGIGIMNIMLVSVTERTREIGVRKAIGATAWKVLVQFLVESSVISIIGGIIGVGLAFGAGQLITQYADIPTQITLSAVGYAFGISVVIGIVFGLMPAIKAARQSPIEALRYE